MRPATLAATAALLLVAGATLAGGRWPWPRRISKDVETIHVTAHRNTPIDLWPDEPPTPAPVDVTRFREALGTICGRMPPSRLERYAGAVRTEAGRFAVDPFLLAALMYDQSRCWPRTPKRYVEQGRFGLTRIPHRMHAPQIRKGDYRYFTREDGAWGEHTLDVSAHKYNEWSLRKVEPNLYFAAAFLRVLALQARSLDEEFEGLPHRHPVSHWFYGDRVSQTEPENRVLTARRRLIEYYSGGGTNPAGRFHGAPIVSPLDGVPRLVIDYFGNRRGKKESRGHRGIDIDGAAGEPVRAIADGRVSFAGVDLDGALNNKQLTPEEAAELTNDEMGPGGLYVSLNHGNDFGTIYMHLETLAVKYRDEVKAGDVIGTLGRSGTEKSGPHLHLEFRVGVQRADPAEPLREVLVNPYL
jgi:murein DD-endopeptidase MepM/ murein hydrolase activator NlpD